jgi:hypothetical protein
MEDQTGVSFWSDVVAAPAGGIHRLSKERKNMEKTTSYL